MADPTIKPHAEALPLWPDRKTAQAATSFHARLNEANVPGDETPQTDGRRGGLILVADRTMRTTAPVDEQWGNGRSESSQAQPEDPAATATASELIASNRKAYGSKTFSWFGKSAAYGAGRDLGALYLKAGDGKKAHAILDSMLRQCKPEERRDIALGVLSAFGGEGDHNNSRMVNAALGDGRALLERAAQELPKEGRAEVEGAIQAAEQYKAQAEGSAGSIPLQYDPVREKQGDADGPLTNQRIGTRYWRERGDIGLPIREEFPIVAGKESPQRFTSVDAAIVHARQRGGEGGAAVVMEDGFARVYRFDDFTVNSVGFAGSSNPNIVAYVTADGKVLGRDGKDLPQGKDSLGVYNVTYGDGLKQLSSKDAFQRTFAGAMEDRLYSLLDQNEAAANAEKQRLERGLSAEENTAIDGMIPQLIELNPKIEETTKNLAEAVEREKKWTYLKEMSWSRDGAPPSPVKKDASGRTAVDWNLQDPRMDAYVSMMTARQDVKRYRSELNGLLQQRDEAARAFPLMRQASQEDLLSGKLSRGNRTEFLKGKADKTLSDIESARSYARNGQYNPWLLGNLREQTASELGISGPQRQWIDEKVASDIRSEAYNNLGQAAVMVGLAFCGPYGWAADAALGAKLAYKDTVKYFADSAAANTNIYDPSGGLLSKEDVPSGWGVTLAWAGAGLDLGVLAWTTKSLSKAGRALESLSDSELQGMIDRSPRLQNDPRALEKLRKLAEAAKVSRFDAAEIGGEEFARRYPQDGALGVFDLKSGRNGVEPHIYVRGDRPPAVRMAATQEETIHFEQFADPRLRPDFDKLVDIGSRWKGMSGEARKEAYAASRRIEFDAKQRELDVAIRSGDRQAAAESGEELDVARREYDDALHNRIPPSELEHPPYLYARETAAQQRRDRIMSAFGAPSTNAKLEAALDKAGATDYAKAFARSRGKDFARLDETRTAAVLDSVAGKSDYWIERNLPGRIRGAIAEAGADNYAGRTQQLAASHGGMDTAAAYTRGDRGRSLWDIAENPGSWLPERKAFQDRLLTEKMDLALKQSEHQTGPAAIYAMRGNTGAGKTRLRQSGLSPELSSEALPVVNPDELKVDLIKGGDVKLTHSQVHIESSVMADRYLKMLLDARNAKGGPAVPSVLVDRRLGSVQEVEALAAEAKRTGRKLNLADVDAPLEQSLIGVLMRKPGGADPITPFAALADGGFAPARANRKAVMELFEKSPDLGRYELYGAKANGEKFLVAKVEDGKVTVLDKSALADLRNKKDAEEYITKLCNTKLDNEEIARVTRDMPDGDWKQRVIESLRKYKGLTWEEAISKHGQL